MSVQYKLLRDSRFCCPFIFYSHDNLCKSIIRFEKAKKVMLILSFIDIPKYASLLEILIAV